MEKNTKPVNMITYLNVATRESEREERERERMFNQEQKEEALWQKQAYYS